MIDTYEIYEELLPNLGDASARSIAKVVGRVYRDLGQTVSREDFDRLVVVVEKLAEAQVKTEQKLDSLAQRVEELAEAQKKTEESLTSLSLRVEELAEAQKKTEQRLDALTQKVEELAEAQRRSERRIEELAEAQKKTENRLEELAEAQKKTEEKLEKLTEWVGTLHKRVEDISSSFGYHLENSAYRFLPRLLEKHGILIQGRLIRRYIGQHQINIFGKAIRNGQEIVILGECKTRPSVKEVKRFERIVNYLQKEGHIKGEVVLVFVAHDFPPEVESFLTERNLLYFWSYDLGPSEVFPH